MLLSGAGLKSAEGPSEIYRCLERERERERERAPVMIASLSRGCLHKTNISEIRCAAGKFSVDEGHIHEIFQNFITRLKLCIKNLS